MLIRVRWNEILRLQDKPAEDQGITIAMIDSGVTPGHPLVGRVAESVQIADNLAVVPCKGDPLGHGTACAMVIKTYCPEARIRSIKIFGDELRAPFKFLERAFHYAIDQRVHLINLSVGVTEKAIRPRLDELCILARRQGIIVIRSLADHPNEDPDSLPNVFVVQADDECEWGQFLTDPTVTGHIRAHPYGVHLPGVDPRSNFFGDSIATAHAAGFLSVLLQGAAPNDFEDGRSWFSN